MSLKKNIVATYVSQIYVTVISIVLVPLYIKYMGVEAYGLVGFFAMLQALFNLLDLGLTPTIARESARYHGGGGLAGFSAANTVLEHGGRVVLLDKSAFCGYVS